MDFLILTTEGEKLSSFLQQKKGSEFTDADAQKLANYYYDAMKKVSAGDDSFQLLLELARTPKENSDQIKAGMQRFLSNKAIRNGSVLEHMIKHNTAKIRLLPATFKKKRPTKSTQHPLPLTLDALKDLINIPIRDMTSVDIGVSLAYHVMKTFNDMVVLVPEAYVHLFSEYHPNNVLFLDLDAGQFTHKIGSFLTTTQATESRNDGDGGINYADLLQQADVGLSTEQDAAPLETQSPGKAEQSASTIGSFFANLLNQQ